MTATSTKPKRVLSPRSRSAAVKQEGHFPCEAEIARRLSQEPGEWAAKAVILERDGLPKIDPVFGGRPWIAVEAWLRRRYGLSRVEATALDGQENLDAL